jgi:Rps23 Pro-64 3,4-dihydroxylase Tpa1-like proline 4-hydroxylase
MIESAQWVAISEFLTREEKDEIFSYANQRQYDFQPSRVTGGIPNFRRSVVLYDFDHVRCEFESRISRVLPDVLNSIPVSLPEYPNYETQLTASRHGDFFRLHSDSQSLETSHRILTFLYYFHREPKSFTGGELRLYDSMVIDNTCIASHTYRELSPESNLLIFFPSRVFHEVLPVVCGSDEFTDSRFTVNGWIGTSCGAL